MSISVLGSNSPPATPHNSGSSGAQALAPHRQRRRHRQSIRSRPDVSLRPRLQTVRRSRASSDLLAADVVAEADRLKSLGAKQIRSPAENNNRWISFADPVGTSLTSSPADPSPNKSMEAQK
jgi:hypothetical protein